MANVKITLLVYACLFTLYISYLFAYLTLRRRAQASSAGRPIIQLPWWKTVCRSTCAALLLSAAIWTIALAALFVSIKNSWDKNCPPPIPPAECSLLSTGWQSDWFVLAEIAGVIFPLIILRSTYSSRLSSPSSSSSSSAPSAQQQQRHSSYPLQPLTISHCLLVISWLLCTPLVYPLRLYGLVGPHWRAVSLGFSGSALILHVLGTTYWIAALHRGFCLWRSRGSRGRRSARAQWPGGRDRDGDIALQDL